MVSHRWRLRRLCCPRRRRTGNKSGDNEHQPTGRGATDEREGAPLKNKMSNNECGLRMIVIGFTQSFPLSSANPLRHAFSAIPGWPTHIIDELQYFARCSTRFQACNDQQRLSASQPTTLSRRLGRTRDRCYDISTLRGTSLTNVGGIIATTADLYDIFLARADTCQCQQRLSAAVVDSTGGASVAPASLSGKSAAGREGIITLYEQHSPRPTCQCVQARNSTPPRRTIKSRTRPRRSSHTHIDDTQKGELR